MYLTVFAIFSVSELWISQKSRFVGVSKHHYFDPKNRSFTVSFVKKLCRNIYTGSIKTNKNNNITPSGSVHHPSQGT